MTETSDALLTYGGAVAGILAYGIYRLYTDINCTAFALQKVETVEIGAELKKRLQALDNHCISYAAVQGVVTAQGKTFKTKNSPTEGVILLKSVTEFASQVKNGVWLDEEKVLEVSIDVAPFALLGARNPGHLMMVTDASEVKHLSDCLEVTHSEYTAGRTMTLTTLIKRIVFGKVTEGYVKSEQMLAVGTSLLGFGEIVLEEGKLKLRPPQAEGLNYYLTTLTKGQVVSLLQVRCTALKVTSVILGFVAASMIGLVMWREFKRHLEWLGEQREREEIRQTRRRHAQARGSSDSTGEDLCVVCMDSPREVVTLNCRHMSMCADCAYTIPDSRCPVCRDPIERLMPVYKP